MSTSTPSQSNSSAFGRLAEEDEAEAAEHFALPLLLLLPLLPFFFFKVIVPLLMLIVLEEEEEIGIDDNGLFNSTEVVLSLLLERRVNKQGEIVVAAIEIFSPSCQSYSSSGFLRFFMLGLVGWLEHNGFLEARKVIQCQSLS